jgi:hypothetical protein
MFFGSRDCQNCEQIWNLVREQIKGTKHGIVYVDAMLDGNQNLCDMWGVDQLPFAAVFGSNNKIFFAEGNEIVNALSPKEIYH